MANKRKEHPELFAFAPQEDNLDFLQKIGISFPETISQNIQTGYLKFLPQDFIVEEVLKNGSVQTIDATNLNNQSEAARSGTIYATLVKCGLSTIEAVEEMASLLSMEKKKIQYAGIKDKDAITGQLISFRGANMETIRSISSPYFFLKDIYFGKGIMEVGGLQGNRFTILVRTAGNFDQQKFLYNLEVVKKEGFFNFYYSQRFGSPRFVNWMWGLNIIKGEYEKAVLGVFCDPGVREIAYFKTIREEIKNNFGNWEKISEMLAPLTSLNTEIKMVNYLKNNPKDFLGALKQVPEQITLWIFAYCSLLFNKKISQYANNQKLLPVKLPLISSTDQNDWLQYSDFLAKDGISKMPTNALKPFPFIQWKKRDINTKEAVQIHNVKTIKEGIVLSFTLPKGCYATSFLSHLFELVSGTPPSNISNEKIDIKEALGEKPMQEVLEKFKEVNLPKTQDVLEKAD